MTLHPRQRALKIVKELVQRGYTAYFAGGCVRDSLLGIDSNEIDIATSASPDIVQKIFPKTVAVGASFGVIVVVYDEGSFEVATFRHDGSYIDGRHPEGVDFSTPEKDAKRRDFTINGMFFNPLKDEILDFVGGQEDLSRKVIRAIGDPEKRFKEDRLRMLRAVRFSHRFNFKIEKDTQEAIENHASTLFPSVSVERVWQELSKMAAHGNFGLALCQLNDLGLLKVIFPELKSLNFPRHLTSSKIPLAAYLPSILPNLSEEQLLSICSRMKTSGDEIKLVEFLFQVSKAKEKADWAPLYADPRFNIVLELSDQAETEKHQARKFELDFFVKRIEAKKPLITSHDLMQEGIKPGPQMGKLLDAAQRLAINENLIDKDTILNRLRKTFPF
jgi:poly(A) polymerase